MAAAYKKGSGGRRGRGVRRLRRAGVEVRVVDVHEDDPGDGPGEEVDEVLSDVDRDVVGVEEADVDRARVDLDVVVQIGAFGHYNKTEKE